MDASSDARLDFGGRRSVWVLMVSVLFIFRAARKIKAYRRTRTRWTVLSLASDATILDQFSAVTAWPLIVTRKTSSKAQIEPESLLLIFMKCAVNPYTA